MRFDWDDEKAAANEEKHGVAFETVRRFDFERALRVPDDRMDYGEDRYRSIGYIGDRLHMLVYTDRDDGIRVISLRKANARERKLYHDRPEDTDDDG